MTQLVIVMVCAVLASLAILGWLIILIRKKAPRRQIALILLLLPIAFMMTLLVGGILVANSDAVKTESNYYTVRRMTAIFMEQCGDNTLNISTEWPENTEFGFDARGNIVNWSREGGRCELVNQDWVCTCPTPDGEQ